MNIDRLVSAFLLAPLSLFPLFAIPMVAIERSWVGPAMGIIAVFIAYIGMLLIGIPLIALLRYLNATRWWHLTLAGAIGGACMFSFSGNGILSFTTASGCVCGAVVAATAWLIAFRIPNRNLDTH